MKSLAALVFHRNEIDGLKRAIASIGDLVDEILVVDSSDQSVFNRLVESFTITKLRVARAFPLGCTEPLRPFAYGQIHSDHILSLDADETISAALGSRLRALDEYDGYDVPRFENSIGAYTHLLRIHRAGALQYRGLIHESPLLQGTRGRLAPPEMIVHSADYRRYLSQTKRRASYLAIESFEHPFVSRFLCQEYRGSIARRLLGNRVSVPNPMTAWALATSHRLRRYNPLNDIGGHLRTGRYLSRYVWERYRYFRALTPANQRAAVMVALEVERAGGVIPLLELQDRNYIDRMTASFPWDASGASVLWDLLWYRLENHRRLESWEERPSRRVMDRAETPFSGGGRDSRRDSASVLTCPEPESASQKPAAVSAP